MLSLGGAELADVLNLGAPVLHALIVEWRMLFSGEWCLYAELADNVITCLA